MRLCAVHEQGGVQPYRRKQQSNHDRLLQFIPLIIQHRSNAAKVKGSTKTWALWEKREDKKRNKKTKLSVFVFILLLFTPEQAFVSSENTHLCLQLLLSYVQMEHVLGPRGKAKAESPSF